MGCCLAIWGGGGVSISHLLFVDDSLLFCPTLHSECSNLLRVLSKYERASGQAITQQKMTLFFSLNTDWMVRDYIRKLLDAQIVTEFEKYLGLPMVRGKNKANMFKGLRERIAKRVTSWKEKLISKAGRKVLIKKVAQAIPTYSISLFKLPKGLCNDINPIIAKYWRGQTSNERKIHWINWEQLCELKKNGGMGFQNIDTFNLAMLVK